MANKAKIGLDYYPFTVSFFRDLKVRKLIKYQGAGSVSVYTLLLCNIYENGYYIRWDQELPFIISEATRLEEGYINEVIKCCFTVGLFSREMYDTHKVLTSAGIQIRYQLICKLLKRKHNVSEFKLISSEELPISSEELSETTEELPQRKGNEIKGNEKKANYFFRIREKIYEMKVSDFFKENFQMFLERWEMKKEGAGAAEIFDKMDIDYVGYNFNNENHIQNSFKATAEKINIQKKFPKKEAEVSTKAKNFA